MYQITPQSAVFLFVFQQKHGPSDMIQTELLFVFIFTSYSTKAPFSLSVIVHNVTLL